VKSGRIFIAAEADDSMLHNLFELIGEDHVLFSSDFPHGEGRENAALEILERQDLSEIQKRKLLYDNTVRLFGEP
jgi:predicted TIM-barrel fold metal-dependent hydrolase